VVVRTEPEPFATVTDLGRRIRFHFDERISESVAGGTLADAVTVSPRSGAVRVSHDGRTLDVRIEGGLRPGLVYRVTLLPVVRDLFGNQLRDPFELVFSTGGEPAPTTIAGEVWDRITGRGVGGALVHAVGSDSLVHVARTDEQGIFAFRYLPAGEFLVTGFEDLNRDGEPGAREVQGYVPAIVAQGDTLLVDVPVLPPDTTPAVLARATVLDSTTVVLEFDDYLDPASDASDVQVDLTRDGGLGPPVSRLFHEHEYAAYVQRVTDSLSAEAPAGAGPGRGAPPDSVPPDPVAVPADSVGAGGAPTDTAVVVPGGARTVGQAAGAAPRGPPPLPGVRGAGQSPPAVPPGRILPGRRLVALLEEPLEVGVEYGARVTSVVNINGLTGGGGEGKLLLAAPPPTPADTTAVPDSAAAPDGLQPAAPDTGAVPGGAAPPGGGAP
jgi:hypothetical protein